jgi:hypothetical protein
MRIGAKPLSHSNGLIVLLRNAMEESRSLRLVRFSKTSGQIRAS